MIWNKGESSTMVAVVYAIIILINIFLAFCKKNYRIIQLLSIIAIAVLMCGYRRPFYGDLNNYEYMLDGRMSTTLGLGFIFNLCKTIGLNFWQTHYLLIIVFLCVALYLLKKFTVGPHLAIALFAMYYIIISSDQIKNHTALIFLMLYIIALYDNKFVKAIAFIIIASAIHYSFIVYALLFFVVKEDEKQLARTIIMVTSVITVLEILGIGDVLVLVVSRMGGVVEKYLGAYGLFKLQNYTENRTRFGYLLIFAFQILDYYLVKLSGKWTLETGFADENVQKINAFVLRINLLGFMLFPLFVYNQQWYRLIRDILILDYCVYGNAYYYLGIGSRRRAALLLLCILSVVIWLVGDLCIKTQPDSVLIPFFTNNAFIN